MSIRWGVCGVVAIASACGGVGAAPSATPRTVRGTDVELAAPLDGGLPTDRAQLSRPCRVGTPEHKDADAAVDRIDARITKLAPDGDPGPASHELATLLATPCFELTYTMDPLEFDSGLSLVSWWNAGGETWVRQNLELDGHGTKDAPPRSPNALIWLSVAPTPRRTLTRESAPSSPYASLLCPAREDDCGRDTRGWLSRAHGFFELHARDRRREAVSDDPREDCHKEALASKDAEPFEAFQFCMLSHTARIAALPLGRFRTPKEGWLVLRGRRGHYSFCDDTRAYDLATGVAYVGGSCSGLQLRHDGSVDGAKTDAKRASRSEVGRLPLENLREAALMTLLAPQAQRDVIENGFGWALPEDIVPQSTGGRGVLGISAGFSSGQTTITWAWVKAGREVASGELTWPNHYDDAAADHAVRLIAITEAAFAPLKPTECAEAVPPSPLPSSTAPAVSPLDGKIDASSGGRELDALRNRACKNVRAGR